MQIAIMQPADDTLMSAAPDACLLSDDLPWTVTFISPKDMMIERLRVSPPTEFIEAFIDHKRNPHQRIRGPASSAGAEIMKAGACGASRPYDRW